jgi:hypothetical protein
MHPSTLGDVADSAWWWLVRVSVIDGIGHARMLR